MENTVLFFDTTLRDGEQTPGVSFHLNEKVEFARHLEALGVDMIEAGFAGASVGDYEAVRAVSKAVSTGVCSLARCVEADIVAAAKALKRAVKPRIHVFIATSPLHREAKLNMTRKQVLEAAVKSITLAKSFCEDIEFSCEDATRTEPDFLREICEAAIQAGATTLNIPDTVGYATVDEYGEMIGDIYQNVIRGRNIVLSAHCHNDLGLATATTLEAVRCGARQVECSINGLGERAGNASLEEIVMGLRTRSDIYQLKDNLNTSEIYRISRLAASLSGVEVPPNKAVVGANAFVHQSGIHQHGVLRNRETYEVMKPEDLGIPQGGMVLGKLSGRHALREHAMELGFDLTDRELNAAFEKFKELADRKKDITDRDIMALCREQMHGASGMYQIHSFQIFSGNRMTSTATVSLKMGDLIVTRADCGEGPIEACFHAVDQITGLHCTLESYQLKAVTEGEDALGEATVRVKNKDMVMLGKGVSTDIIEASCFGYINAVNRLIEAQKQSDVPSSDIE
ncbi:MAG: 2-isopropylmalate synthase [Clostridiales bacterium]|nr:2-isopropylmalate synthase [Clostridiales bacterium]